jgi:hypothetical protein
LLDEIPNRIIREILQSISEPTVFGDWIIHERRNPAGKENLPALISAYLDRTLSRILPRALTPIKVPSAATLHPKKPSLLNISTMNWDPEGNGENAPRH